MAVTRAQALAQSETRSGEDSSERENESEGESGDEGDEGRESHHPPASVIQGPSGREYDNVNLSPETWQRVKDGLGNHFEVHYCIEFPSRPQKYYAFRIVPAETQFGVRIGAPGTQYERPTCSCQDYQERLLACKHIFWLSDQLVQTSLDDSLEGPAHLQDNGSSTTGDSPYAQISNRGLRTIAHELGWRFRSHSGQAVDELAFPRKDQVRDILSTFDPDGALPEEYLTDVYEDISSESVRSEDFPSTDTLEATIFRLATYDEAFFRPLREAVDVDHCAIIYFGRLADRADSVFARLNDIVKGNRTTSPTVASCAKYLRRTVTATRKNVEMRAPLNDKAKSKAFYLLLSILNKVCDSNVDAYASFSPSHTIPTDKFDRNLFEKLIGSGATARNEDPPSPRFSDRDEGHFIIDALWDLKPVARDYSDMLGETLEKLTEQRASDAYTAALARFIEQAATSDEGVAGASRPQKRPGAGPTPGQSKRMK
ncbi:MAG: hypothetical protein M1833_003261 [Piccolia ochrophora]|nr:MAG: hypothetical protein M1833_003261 [Piccolia ochrophora]